MESIHNKVTQLVFFAFALSFILGMRLFALQIAQHDYYLQKTLKQKKQNKNPLYSRKYKIFVEKSVFDIEIIPKQLLNNEKQMVKNDSVGRLANLMGYSEEYVWKECLKKYDFLRKKIDKKVQEEYSKGTANKESIIKEKEEMYLSRPYPLFYRVDKKVVMQLEIAKYVWAINNNTLYLQDFYQGFVIRRRTKAHGGK
ncbi:hypothetical protein [Candidatus Uabimicrobium sp. HlEnr_7]|uniref:hypothetical protein n=1 Tax=Candidatus Uabimicrobium helgolandensis TaxID=3095367 RepID=UPI0035583C55